MGLDIRGYSRVRLIEVSTSDNIECKYEWMDDNNIDGVIPYLNLDFLSHCVGLQDGVYTYDTCESGGSRSYSGWSNFREVLAKSVGYVPMSVKDVPNDWSEYEKTGFLLRPHQARVFNVEEGTLFELINFSDCEGVINTEMCKKIYKDLQSVDHLELDERDQWLLYKLIQAFKAGSDDGFVTFS